MKKLLLVLGLVLITQLQPLQVHAIVLDAEQVGHTAGQLSHSHEHQHDSEADADLRLVENQHSTDLQHASDCHPGHVLFPPVALLALASRADPLPYTEPFNGFISAYITLDTPPPKHNS